MRWLPGTFALLALTGCMSAEQRMIALAKTKCAAAIAEAPWRGTLSWTARQYANGYWEIDGLLEPQRDVGVNLMLSPDGSGIPVPDGSVLPCAPLRIDANPVSRGLAPL